MKKIRKKDNGFTLIELLVTITIVALLTTIVAISIQKILEISKVKSNEISINSIKKSASQYTEEFKQEENFWYVDTDDVDKEYSCTTVGMLINKGFLKSDIVGLKLDDGNTIEESTSIKIERNRATKVYEKEVLFNETLCEETAKINLIFTVDGKNSNCLSGLDCPYADWFNEDVTIKIVTTNAEQINDVSYTSKIGNNNEKRIVPTVFEEKKENWSVVVGEQGKNIDVCVNIIDFKDKINKFCLSKDNLTYNMDKESPENLELNLKKVANYQIVAENATDNVTSSENLVYVLSKNPVNKNENSVYDISSDTLTSDDGEDIDIKVYDEAGNYSSLEKKLKVLVSTNGNVTTNTNYYCVYTNDDGTTNKVRVDSNSTNCNIVTEGNVTSETVWYCPQNGKTYTDENTARAECYTKKDNYSPKYYCSNGTLNGSSCIIDTTTASRSTMYGLSCGGSSGTTTYSWSSSSQPIGGCGVKCTSSSSTCSSSSDVGNTKVTCAAGSRPTYTSESACKSANFCGCSGAGTVWKPTGGWWGTETTSTCVSTTTGGSKTYTGITGSGSTSGQCPSGYTEVSSTLNNNTCNGYIGNSCTSNCTSCCGKYYTLTCRKSTSASLRYYCSLTGEYSNSVPSNCYTKTFIEPTSSTTYSCEFDNVKYSNINDAYNSCKKTQTGENKTEVKYMCSVTNQLFDNKEDADNQCKNYCEPGASYYENRCYSLN